MRRPARGAGGDSLDRLPTRHAQKAPRIWPFRPDGRQQPVRTSALVLNFLPSRKEDSLFSIHRDFEAEAGDCFKTTLPPFGIAVSEHSIPQG